ncbi:MAG: hypothetical protein ACD_26C00088G0002, partial [uncultured bacterium]
MQNIEIKILINNFKPILESLSEIQDKYKGDLNQIDTYYNCKTGRLKAREINRRDYEIIFYQRPDKIDSKVSNYKIIKINKNQLKDIKKIFRLIFGEKVIVKKKRHLWIYKNTRIHLDEVKNLGKF